MKTNSTVEKRAVGCDRRSFIVGGMALGASAVAGRGIYEPLPGYVPDIDWVVTPVDVLLQSLPRLTDLRLRIADVLVNGSVAEDSQRGSQRGGQRGGRQQAAATLLTATEDNVHQTIASLTPIKDWVEMRRQLGPDNPMDQAAKAALQTAYQKLLEVRVPPGDPLEAEVKDFEDYIAGVIEFIDVWDLPESNNLSANVAPTIRLADVPSRDEVYDAIARSAGNHYATIVSSMIVRGMTKPVYLRNRKVDRRNDPRGHSRRRARLEGSLSMLTLLPSLTAKVSALARELNELP